MNLNLSTSSEVFAAKITNCSRKVIRQQVYQIMIKKGELYYPTPTFQKKAWANNPKIYKIAARNPVKFWEKQAREIFWFKKWEKAFFHNPPYFKWFLGGKTNITSTIFEKNAAGFEKIKNKPALIWEPEPVSEKPRIFTYGELLREVNRFANGLKGLGVKKGDRVGIYLPMIPEIVVAMLACARIGAAHSVVFSAFSPSALKVRLQDTGAKILITADGYYRRGKIVNLKNNADLAIAGNGDAKTKVKKVVVIKRIGNGVSWTEGRDIWHEDLIKNGKDACPAQIMDSEDLLFILYTSGSTGKPKGCLHSCGGYAVQAKSTGKLIFDLKGGDVFWCTSDPGWITGHTYTIYSPLLNAATTLMFEGAPDWPGPDRWAKIIDKYKVTIFYTAPTAIRMFESYGTEAIKKSSLKTLRLLGTVGEPIDESAWLWYYKEIGRENCPIVDTWWQTETGGILITSLPGIGPFKPAFTGLPFPGARFEILNENGRLCPAGVEGNLVLLPPFAPGLLRGIYKNSKKYAETYWSQYSSLRSGQAGKIYFTSDAALKDKNGLIRIIGRVDDVIKVAGHRLATGELEAAINSHPDINECAVVGIADAIKGETPAAFVVYSGSKKPEELQKEVAAQIQKIIGPIALPKKIYIVEDLPKTRSGKIMRRILKKIFNHEELGDLSTLANPESVEKIKTIIKNDN